MSGLGWRRALLALLVTGAVGALLYVVPGLLVTGALSPAKRAQAIAEERRTLLALVATAGGAISLYYTHKRHQLESDSNATGRYTTAVEQLAHPSESVRLGGIYALDRIAADSRRDRQTIADVLAAYVRGGGLRAENAGPAEPVVRSRVPGGPATAGDDVLAAGRVLAWRKAHGWSSSRRLDLTQAELTGATFPGADFRRDYLAAVVFTRAILSRARFDGAHLALASFEDADLETSSFRGANLTGADFGGANLDGADFTGAHLARTRFDGASLSGAIFSEGSTTT